MSAPFIVASVWAAVGVAILALMLGWGLWEGFDDEEDAGRTLGISLLFGAFWPVIVAGAILIFLLTLPGKGLAALSRVLHPTPKDPGHGDAS